MGSRRLFGTNGIRGVVNQELTPQFAIQIGEAVGTFFNQGKIILGSDSRISNTMLRNAIKSGLVSTGCSVYDVEEAPTPCIQLAARNHKMDGGVIITASHNPPEYNGIKVIGEDGVELPRSSELEIENLFFERKPHRAEWREIRQSRRMAAIINEYKDAIMMHVDDQLIRKAGYHVVVDAANSVGALVAPRTLKELGCKVTAIHADVDGVFPGRLPEPRPNHLQDLVKTVRAVKADFGVAFDGDADRSIFVDEKGRIGWGDRTFALIERHFLVGNPGETIVTPVSSSQVVKDIADEYEGKLVWTKVGSTIVSQTMKELGAKLGGEENGGVFYGPHQPVRDGTMTVALILNIMAATGKKLSQLLDSLPQYYLKKSKINCPQEKKTVVAER